MTYIGGKCYDNAGNEMSVSQINMMYEASQAYIKSILKPKSRELTREELIDKFKNSNFKIN